MPILQARNLSLQDIHKLTQVLTVIKHLAAFAPASSDHQTTEASCANSVRSTPEQEVPGWLCSCSFSYLVWTILNASSRALERVTKHIHKYLGQCLARYRCLGRGHHAVLKACHMTTLGKGSGQATPPPSAL